ncbi:MAG: bifunctional (p)ppGpp synthetase/guanosine-3',5'-bis(diphosphate) 3'-pyrophosphohydrolase [Clostridia bacterium]|nr:bifunctional (p)ppGpp synthetase/guanosine-3',5'-bis(diphosphate) 3'-pyrophosphohydrolase [Clostridia bacterium]
MTKHEQIFEQIVQNLQNKDSSDISNVIKAYKFAKEKHKDQFRKSGEPYILHPVEVAQILESLDFNTDVISAAILHDTVEDCGVTIEEIENRFNKQISQIVDAVTAISKENFIPDNDNLYENTDDFLKLAVEDQTYQKLISIGKSNKFGFYIKFADRLHNLKTIGIFARHKKEAKITETKKWIIPLAKLLKSKYFYDNLYNECFLISTEDQNTKFVKSYNNYFKNTKKYLRGLKTSLINHITPYISNSKENLSLYKIRIEPKTHYEIYKNISRRFEVNKLENVKGSNFVYVPTFNVYIILNENLPKENSLSLLYQIIEDTELAAQLKIIGYDIDMLGNKFLLVKDNFRNLFNISLLSRHSYTEMRTGTIKGTDIDMLDETMTGGIDTKYITVFSPTKEKIKIPSKSTVLDFAFKLHNDIGFSCKYAYINNSPDKSPIYTRLNNGDKVEIVCELENGLNVNIAELRWLAYCKNESTQRKLIKYFEKKFN